MSEKKLNRRQFLKVASVVVAGAGLAACKAKVVTAPPQATKPPEATKPSAAPSATPPPAAPVTIKQWYHVYGEQGVEEAVNRYAKEYQAVKPNVTVEVGWMPDQTGSLQTARAAGDAPDIYEDNNGIDQIKNGDVASLDGLLTPEEEADYPQSMIKRNRAYDGHLYALQNCIDTGTNTYRKSLFAEADITAAPAILTDFTAAAKALTKGAMKGLFLGNDSGINDYYFIHLMWSTGIKSYLTEDNKPTFVTQAVADVLTEFKKLATSDAMLIGAPADWWDPSAFNDGLCAMQQNGLWAIPAIMKGPFADDWDCFPWPAAAAGVGTPSTFLGGHNQSVNPKSKALEEAKAFLRWIWFENTEIQEDFNLSYGFHIPPRISLAKKAKALQSGGPAKIVAALKYAQIGGGVYWNGVMDQAINELMTDVCTKDVDPMEALKAAADKVNAEMPNLTK